MKSSLNEYKKIDAGGQQDNLDPYKIVQLLMKGALDKINIAQAAMHAENIAEKGENISLAITIIDALQASLDHERGGEISNNLFRLYQYAMEKLVTANYKNDIEMLKEVSDLLTTIKEGWDGIEAKAPEILDKLSKEKASSDSSESGNGNNK